MAAEPKHGEDITFEGTVKKQISRNGTWCVLIMQPQHGAPIKVYGDIPETMANNGDILEIDGVWEDSQEHGLQVSVKTVVPRLPSDEHALVTFLSSDAFPGIGRKTAEKIVQHFGVEGLDKLRDAPGKIKAIDGIGEAIAETLINGLQGHWDQKEAVAFLHRQGLPQHLIQRSLSFYGNDIFKVLQNDPYELQNIKGIGFNLADGIAKSFRHGPNDLNRLMSALMFVADRDMFQFGHTWVPRSKLVKRTKAQLKPNGVANDDAVEEALDKLIESHRLLELDTDPPGVTTYQLFNAERSIAECTVKAMATELIVPPPDPDSFYLADIEGNMGLDYSDQQREAIEMACREPMMVLSGGPGTGKSTTVDGIVRAWRQVLGLKTDQIALTSPTGRAAQRLKEVTGLEADTIHRLLRAQKVEGGRFEYTYDAERPLRQQAFIIDEASMMTAELASAFFTAVPEGSRVVIVGDHEQLPAVGAGNVLRDMLAVDDVPSVVLDQPFRQTEHSNIVKAAYAIRRGEMPIAVTEGMSDTAFIEVPDPSKACEAVQAVVKQAKTQGLTADQVQVLTPVHKGDAGTQALNRKLQTFWNERAGADLGLKMTVGNFTYYSGDRMLCTTNHQAGSLKIRNGEIGKVEDIIPAAMRSDGTEEDEQLVVRYGGSEEREVMYDRNAVRDNLRPAYAMTVHKSQGSEFDYVIAVLVHNTTFLDRSLVYTALTRPKVQWMIVGKKEVIRKAIHRTHNLERRTQLAYWLDRIKPNNAT